MGRVFGLEGGEEVGLGMKVLEGADCRFSRVEMALGDGGGGDRIIVEEPEGMEEEADFEAVDIVSSFAVIDERVDELAEGGVPDLCGDVVSKAEGAAVPLFGESAGGAGEAPEGIE